MDAVGTILGALEALGARIENRLEGISGQLQQHSAMLASIAKSLQIHSNEDIEECKSLETQVKPLQKEKEGMKEHLVGQETYKRRWCLQIEGKKEKVDENIRAEVVELLSRIRRTLLTQLTGWEDQRRVDTEKL